MLPRHDQCWCGFGKVSSKCGWHPILLPGSTIATVARQSTTALLAVNQASAAASQGHSHSRVVATAAVTAAASRQWPQTASLPAAPPAPCPGGSSSAALYSPHAEHHPCYEIVGCHWYFPLCSDSQLAIALSTTGVIMSSLYMIKLVEHQDLLLSSSSTDLLASAGCLHCLRCGISACNQHGPGSTDSEVLLEMAVL